MDEFRKGSFEKHIRLKEERKNKRPKPGTNDWNKLAKFLSTELLVNEKVFTRIIKMVEVQFHHQHKDLYEEFKKWKQTRRY